VERWRGKGGAVAGSWWSGGGVVVEAWRGRGGGVGVVVEASGSWWRRRGRGGVGVVVASGSWWRRGRGGDGGGVAGKRRRAEWLHLLAQAVLTRMRSLGFRVCAVAFRVHCKIHEGSPQDSRGLTRAHTKTHEGSL
jgi:hypothetical protein